MMTLEEELEAGGFTLLDVEGFILLLEALLLEVAKNAPTPGEIF